MPRILTPAPAPIPVHADRSQPLSADNHTHDRLLRGLRAIGERAAADLKQRWRALQYVTLSPSRVGIIAQAALVLNNAWKQAC
ncbi:transposase family protein [Streptomyces sp. NPDC056486]|uniref:transposase family protein n=1 Tax=Streptomyces sp. NPDC056486 TaxID=3345835 RepID=UPI0036964BD7